MNFLVTFLIGLIFITSCVPSAETYDPTLDDGTYSGSTTVYDGEGITLAPRVCPKVSASITVQNGTINYTLTDDFSPYVHGDATMEMVHTGTTNVLLNNQFGITHNYTPGTAVQSDDISILKICGTSFGPPLDLSAMSTLTIKFGSKGFTGEFGLNNARASILYGVTCSTGEFLPVCLYYWEGTK